LQKARHECRNCKVNRTLILNWKNDATSCNCGLNTTAYTTETGLWQMKQMSV